MRDLPGGQWSPLLIGHQWPGSDALAALAASAENRAAAAAAHNSYAESLRAIRMGLLAGQQGVAAESAREAFRAGEQRARGVVENNETKRDSYRWAHRYVAELRSALGDIAAGGNAEIQQVLDSRRPLADKVNAIVSTIAAAQTQANAKAAECSANLLGVIETALGTAQSGLSAREFTSANGVDLPSAFRSPSPENLQSRVETALGESDPHDPLGATTVEPTAGQAASNPTAVTQHPGQTGLAPAAGPNAPGPVSSAVDSSPSDAEAFPAPESAGPREPGTEPAATRGAAPGGIEAPAAGLEVPGLGAAIAEPPSASGGEPPPGPAAAQPNEIAAPAAGVPPTVIAPVVAPAGAPGMPPSPMTAGAPNALPAYGSDLRPAAAAPGLGPSPAPAAAAGSAPVGAAGASASAGQPVAVRSAPQAAAGLTGMAATATAGGVPSVAAVSGPGSRNRLRRLLGSVARQQPRLRWAVGDLEGGGTLLVTDLAGGWIPPGIDIPAEVRLLQPRGSAGDLASLLGPATLTLAYQPGQHLPPADEGEPVAMSGQARQGTAVDDLGWELVQATRWREGLPRLAHTMAKAASARSGFLISEVDLLREYLDAVAGAVLSRYPSSVNITEVGNWQLLAATEAIIAGETVCAEYHFAWFLADVAVRHRAGDR